MASPGKDTRPMSPIPRTDNPASANLEKQDEHHQASTELNHYSAPDGGITAWAVVMGAWATSFCSFGWLNSVGIFQEYYQKDLLKQYDPSTIAWIPSLQIFFMLGSGPIIGQIYDRHGPRLIILIGTFMHFFGIMMASISHKYYQILLAQGVCSAIGAAAIFQPALSCVGGWFEKKRAAAFGLLSTGSSTGGVVFPIMVTHLINKVGYGWAMRISGFIILFLLIIANLTVRCRVPPKPQKIKLRDLYGPLHEPAFISVLVGFAFLTFGMFIPINYLVVSSTAGGMSASLAEYLVSMFNGTSLFGRMSAGLIADKVGRYNVFTTVCAISGILILGLWLPGDSNATNILFANLFGFFSGAYISLSPALVAQISPIKELGYRMGLLYFSAAIPGLVTNPIAGAILQDNGSYSGMKIFCGCFALVGTLCVAVSRFIQSGPKLLARF